MLYPSGITAKVRGVQVHNQAAEAAEAGMRTAVNFQGLEKAAVDRGEVLSTPKRPHVELHGRRHVPVSQKQPEAHQEPDPGAVPYRHQRGHREPDLARCGRASPGGGGAGPAPPGYTGGPGQGRPVRGPELFASPYHRRRQGAQPDPRQAQTVRRSNRRDAEGTSTSTNPAT